MDINRRLIIAGSLVGGATLMSSCASGASASSAPGQSFPNLYDVKVPEENLEAFVKVMGDLNGASVWYTAQGVIYLIRDGEMPLPLLGVNGLRYAKFEAVDGGFRQYTRDWGVYRDVDTNEVLTRFKNPITGKTVAPKPLLTPYYGWDMMADTGQFMEGYEGEAWLMDKPFNLPWVREGNDVAVTLPLLVKYASGTGGGEWMNLMSKVDELNDPGRTQASCRLQWTGHSPIMGWLDMPDVKGRTLWNSMGAKHASLDSIPAQFLQDIARAYPGSLEAPETYKKPS